MSLSCDPEARVEVWLPYYEATPAETRPTYLMRHLTSRKYFAVEQILEDAGKLNGNKETSEKLNQALDILLVGWRNLFDPETRQPIPFGREQFDDISSPVEKWQLIGEALRKIQMTEIERGKSSSPSM